MREILFRGRDLYDKKWVYGYYCKSVEERLVTDLICDEKGMDWIVDTETVGEWTGLVDRNGVKIFEGDIIACRHWSTDRTGEAKSSVFFTGRVHYSYGDFYLSGWSRSEYLRDFGDREVIGNIHDNPELLEGGEV